MWDLSSGKEIHYADSPHLVGAKVLAYSPDGRALAAGGSGDICFLDPATLRIVGHARVAQSWRRILGIVYSPDGSAITAGFEDGPVRMWTAPAGRLLSEFNTGRSGLCCSEAFSLDSKTFASGDYDGSIQCWDLASRKVCCRLAGHADAVFALTFAPDGKTLASGGYGGTLIVWDMAKASAMFQLRVAGSISSLAYSRDGKTLAGGCHDGSVHLWDLATRKERHSFIGHRGPVGSLTFSSDGKTLVSASDDATALVWDLDGRAPPPKRGEKRPGPAFDYLWQQLGSNDAAVAYGALWTLVERGDESVVQLQTRVKPVPGISRDQIDRLIADLDDDRFAVREKAAEELGRIREIVLPILMDQSNGQRSAELRRRTQQLLKDARSIDSPSFMAEIRSIEALERMGIPRARQLLSTLAAGTTGVRLTNEARFALRRLQSWHETDP
jgi:hypothetical protein